MAIKQPALISARDNRKKKKEKEILKAPTAKATVTKPKTITVKSNDKGKTYVDRSTISKKPTVQNTTQNRIVTNKDRLTSKSNFGGINNDIRTVKTTKKSKPKQNYSVGTYDIYKRDGRYYYNDGKEKEVDKNFVEKAIKEKKTGVIGNYDSKGQLRTTDSRGNVKAPEKNLLKNIARVGKGVKLGGEKGAISIASKELQDLRSDLDKGEKIKKPMDYLSQISNIIYNSDPRRGMGTAIKNAANNAKELWKDNEKKTLEKVVGTFSEAAHAGLNGDKQGIKDAATLWGAVLPKDTDKKVEKLERKINEPINKKLEKFEEEKENYSNIVNRSADIGRTVGNMIPGIGASVITRNPDLGILATMASVRGQSTERAEKAGKDLDEAIKYGDLMAAIEGGTEYLSGGLKVFGKGPKGNWLKGGSESIDDVVMNAINAKVTNPALNFALKSGAGITGEQFEEVLSDILGTVVDIGTIDPNATYTLEDLKRTLLDTGLSTIAINALTGGYGSGAYNSNINDMNKFNIQQQQANEVAQRVEAGEIDAQEGNALLEQVKDGTYQQNRNLEQIAMQESQRLQQAAQQGIISQEEYTQGLQTLTNTVNQTREQINAPQQIEAINNQQESTQESAFNDGTIDEKLNNTFREAGLAVNDAIMEQAQNGNIDATDLQKRYTDFVNEHKSDFDNANNKNVNSKYYLVDNNLVKVTTTTENGKIYIDELYVEKQNNGTGTKVVDAIKDYAKANNLEVEASKELQSAKGFWDKALDRNNNVETNQNENIYENNNINDFDMWYEDNLDMLVDKFEGKYKKAPVNPNTGSNNSEWVPFLENEYNKELEKSRQKTEITNNQQESAQENINNDVIDTKESKIRDDNGNLLKVYHRSHTKNIKQLEPKNGAIFFTDDSNASYYGNEKYSANLNIKNPLIIDGEGANFNQIKFDLPNVKQYNSTTIENAINNIDKLTKKDVIEIAKAIDKNNSLEDFIDVFNTPKDALDSVVEAYTDGGTLEDFVKQYGGLNSYIDNKNIQTNKVTTTRDIVDYAKNNGYDGVVFKNVQDKTKGVVNVYAAFNSDQIVNYKYDNDDIQNIEPKQNENIPATKSENVISEETKPQKQKTTKTNDKIDKRLEKYKNNNLTKEQQNQILKIKDEVEKYKELMNSEPENIYSSEEKGRKIKGYSLQAAGEIREIVQGDSLDLIDNGLTPTELQKKLDRENSNYNGKEVIVDGKKGKILSRAYGKYKIELEDGNVVTKTKEEFEAAKKIPRFVSEVNDYRTVNQEGETTEENEKRYYQTNRLQNENTQVRQKTIKQKPKQKVKDTQIRRLDQKSPEILDKMPVEKNTTIKSLKKGLDKFRQEITDRFAPVYDMARKMKNPTLYHEADAILKSDAMAQVDLGMNQVNLKGKPYKNFTDENGNKVSMSYEKAYDLYNEIPVKAKNEYLVHWLNVDRLNQGVDQFGIPLQDSLQKIQELENEYENMGKWSENIYQFYRNLTQNMVDNGRVSQELADKWLKETPHFVHIERQVPNKGNQGVSVRNGKVDSDNLIRKVKGGNYPILPIKESTARYVQNSRRAFAYNQFGKEYARTIGYDSRGNNVSESADIDEIFGFDPEFVNSDGKGNYTMKIYEKGVTVEIPISEDVYNSLSPKNIPRVGVLAEATNLYKDLLTNKNPFFGFLRNPIRDAGDMFLYSKHPLRKSLATYGKLFAGRTALKNRIMTKDGVTAQDIVDFYNNTGNGAHSFYRNGQFESQKGGIRKGIDKALSPIEKGNDFMESMPRITEFWNTIQAEGYTIKDGELVPQQGKNPKKTADQVLAEASFYAADVTVNFKRGGRTSKAISQNGGIFFNPSVQGASKFTRNITEAVGDAKAGDFQAAKRLVARAAMMGVAPAILSAAMYGGDDDYEEMQDYQKDQYYLIRKGNGKWIRIPKGRAISLFESATRRTIDKSKGNKDSFKGYGQLVMNQIAPNNPLDNNIASPIFAAINNKSWSGNKIVSDSMAKRPVEEQFNEKTDELSKKLGKQLHISPMKINYVLDQYSGVLGDLILPQITPRSSNGTSNPIVSILKDNYTFDAANSNKSVGNFYDVKGKLNTKANSVNPTSEDKLKSQYMNKQSQKMYGLYTKKQKIQMDKSLSKKEKYEQSLEVQKEINKFAKKATENVKDIDIKKNTATIGGDLYYKNKNSKSGWSQESEKTTKTRKELGLSPEKYYYYKNDESYKTPDGYTRSITSGKNAKQTIAIVDAFNFDPSDYLKYKYKLSQIHGDKDSRGRTIRYSARNKKIKYLNSLPLSGAQKAYLMKQNDKYYKSSDSSLKKAISNSNLSNKEKQEIYSYLKLGR